MLMDMAVETGVVLNQKVQAKRGLVQVDDHTPRPAALGIVHPALLGGRVIGVVQAETLGSLQVLGREDDGVLPIPGALFLPLRHIVFGLEAVHAVAPDVQGIHPALGIPRVVDRAQHTLGQDGVAQIAVAEVPGRLDPGLRVCRIEHGKGQTGDIAAELAVGSELDASGVLHRGLDVVFERRKVDRVLDGNGKVSGLDDPNDFRR